MRSCLNVSRRAFVAGMASSLALSSLGLLGCGAHKYGDRSGGNGVIRFKMGAVGDLSGTSSRVGEAVKNGFRLAIDQLTDKAGAVQFHWNFLDDVSDAEKAIRAYDDLVTWDMSMLLGSVTTDSCVAVTSEAEAGGYFQIVPCASSPDVTGGVADPNGAVTVPRKRNVFQMCPSNVEEARVAVRTIEEEGLGGRVAVLYNAGDSYSVDLYKRFVNEAHSAGLDVVAAPSFADNGVIDFAAQVAEARGAGAEVVFLPVSRAAASRVLSCARDAGYAPRFFGGDGLDGILTMPNFDRTLAEGVYLLSVFSPDSQDELAREFAGTYSKTYGETPNQFSALGYDSIMAVAKALEQRGLTADMSPHDLLEGLADEFASGLVFSGATGENMTWNDNGEVSRRPSCYVISGGSYQLVS